MNNLFLIFLDKPSDIATLSSLSLSPPWCIQVSADGGDLVAFLTLPRFI